MDPRQAELSRTIDASVLGRRIRNARLAAGLRQAGVAQAAGVTTAYISRIESGGRRPEASKLVAMAAAMGVSVDELIEPVGLTALAPAIRFKLDQAQLAFAAGSVAEADSAAREVVNTLGSTRADEGARWQAELLIALCHEARGNLDQAIVDLERIAAAPRAEASWTKVLIALSRCYREAGDMSRAIEVGERGIATVADLGSTQTSEIVQLSLTVAAAYAEKGDVDAAARICLRAAADAADIDSPIAQASAYWNGSIMEARRGHADSAVALASKAVAIFDLADDRRNMGKLRTDLALMQLAMDPPQVDKAKRNLELARRDFDWSSATPSDRGRNTLVMAHVLAAGGSQVEALGLIDEVIVADLGAPMLAAEAKVARGRLLAEMGEKTEALSSFRDAVLIASSVGADRSAAQFWFDLAELLDSLGDHEAARDAYRRSAASAGMMSRHMQQVRA